MPLSNTAFHFFFIVEIILAILVIIYTYSSEIMAHVNFIFDSEFTSFQKLQTTLYNPLILVLRLVQPQYDENTLFWFFELPVVIFFVTIFEIAPLISGNVDLYQIATNIYWTFVGRRRNNYNFTETTNNYGNYIPVMLLFIALFVFLLQIFGPIFSFIFVLILSVFFYAFFNFVYMFFVTKNKKVVDTIKKYAINDYIFIVIFAMVWAILIMFLYSASKTIMDSYKAFM